MLHVAFSDGLYGADRAAYRIHQSLRDIGVDSEMLVQKGVTGDPSVHVIETIEPRSEIWRRRKLRLVRWLLSVSPRWLIGADLRAQRSLAFFSSKVPEFVHFRKYTLVHMHWVNGEMLSLADIARIRVPVFWSCHDQWPFKGLLHYEISDVTCFGGASSKPTAGTQLGLLDRWVLARKHALFAARQITLVCPSVWMAERAAESRLPALASLVVHLPLDTRVWKRSDYSWIEPSAIPTVAFGAVGGGRDPRKGYDLFIETLHHLKHRGMTLRVILFGDQACDYYPEPPMPTVKLGRLDDEALRMVYSSSAIVCVCSRIDNSPMVVLEAMACETPVIAFGVGGVSELIVDGVTGFVVEPGNTQEFAEAIANTIYRDYDDMGYEARQFVEKHFAPNQTASQLVSYYKERINLECR